MSELSPVRHKYKFQFTCERTPGILSSRVHHRFYSCHDVDTAVTQFKAGCEHKGTQPENVQVFRYNPELRFKKPWEHLKNVVLEKY